jgi:hypothetical protein
MVGNRIVSIGTWESHTVPNEAPNELKKRRREYDGMAVGLPHIRGVDGVRQRPRFTVPTSQPV